MNELRRPARGRVRSIPLSKTLGLLGVAAVVIVTAAVMPAVANASAGGSSAVTLWGSRPTGAPRLDSDQRSVELGTVFTAKVAGEVTGVRFWKTPENSGRHTGSLWGPGGRLLAQAVFTGETPSGWQSVDFSTPVRLIVGQSYVVSYHAPGGHYSETTSFTGQSITPDLAVPRGSSGVYSYGRTPTLPTRSWHSAQYWVDVLFTPSSRGSSRGTPAGTPTPSSAASGSTPTPSSRPAPTPSAEPTGSSTRGSTASPTSTPSGKPSSTPTPTPTQSADPVPSGVDAPASIGKGWQLTPSSVGLAPFGLKCSALPAYKPSSSVVPAGTVIDEQRITGPLDLSAGNITIKRSCIQPVPGAVGDGSTVLKTADSAHGLQGPVTIEDSEYDGSLLSQYDQAWTQILTGVASYYRDYIHNTGSGLNTYGSYEKTGADVVIENNYVDKLIATGDPTTTGNHQSAYSVRDFDTSVNPDRQLLIKDNYLNCDGSSCTGAFFIQANAGDIKNVTAEGNLLAGGGWEFYLDYQPGRFPGVTYDNVRAVDNRMTGEGWGPVFVREGGPGLAQWQDNYLYDPNGVDGEGKKLPDPS